MQPAPEPTTLLLVLTALVILVVLAGRALPRFLLPQRRVQQVTQPTARAREPVADEWEV